MSWFKNSKSDELNPTLSMNVRDPAGFLVMGRYTTTEINALTGMNEGTWVYDTTLHQPKFWNGTVWRVVAGA